MKNQSALVGFFRTFFKHFNVLKDLVRRNFFVSKKILAYFVGICFNMSTGSIQIKKASVGTLYQYVAGGFYYVFIIALYTLSVKWKGEFYV